MPVFKLDLVFEARGRGWEETYYRNFTNPDFGQAFTVANTLAMKRIALSAPPVFIKAYRIEDPTTPGRQGQVYYFNPVMSATESAGQGAASPDAAINQSFIYNANNATRQQWLRGIWDAAITQFNQLSSPEFAAWYSLWTVYRTYLLQQGFGWMQSQAARRNVPVSYSLAPNPTIPVFTFPAGTFTDPGEVGTFMRIRFSRFNGSKSDLNRELVVQITSANTATVAAPIAAGAMITPGRAIIYDPSVFRPADNVGVTRVGRRAPGAPLLYTPGRRRNRSRT
jgi:hypothetical protein